jgi:hypothetical protein
MEKIIRSILCTLTKHTIGRVRLPPPTREGLRLGHGLSPIGGPMDRLGIRLHGGVIPSPGRAQQIAELVYPTPLMGRAGIDRLPRRRQSRTAIGHDQLKLAAL